MYKLCICCGTRNEANSSRCWYCHAIPPHDYAAPEPQAVCNDENQVARQKERTTVVCVVLRMHVVSEALGDLTPNDDEIIQVALDHTRAMLETTDDLPNDKGHRLALAGIHAAEVVDRR